MLEYSVQYYLTQDRKNRCNRVGVMKGVPSNKFQSGCMHPAGNSWINFLSCAF